MFPCCRTSVEVDDTAFAVSLDHLCLDGREVSGVAYLEGQATGGLPEPEDLPEGDRDVVLAPPSDASDLASAPVPDAPKE